MKKPKTSTGVVSSRLVRRYRTLRLKERLRAGDQFYHYIRCRWKRVSKNTIETMNHFGGVPEHYKGRFRRRAPSAKLCEHGRDGAPGKEQA